MTASINFMPARQSRLSGIAAALLLNLLAIWLLLSAHQNMPLATRSRSVIVELLPLPQSRTPEAPAAPARKAPRPSTSVAVRHAAQPSVTPQPAKQPAPGAMTQPDIVLDAPVTRAPALNLDGLRDSVRNSLRQSQAKASEVRDLSADRKSTRLNSSHAIPSRMPSSA